MIEAPRSITLRFERLKEERPSESLQLKKISDNYYVHSVTSEWDGTRKRVVKVSEHVGAITSDGIFIEKGAGRIRESSREVFEYGNGALAHALLSDAEEILRGRDVPTYKELVACAVIRVLSPSPMRLLESRWERLHLSKTMPNVDLSPRHVSDVLKDAGRHVTWWYDLFSKLAGDGGLLLYDLTTIFTHSQSMKLAEKGYNPDHQYVDQIGVMMAFSCKDSVPVGIDVSYGSVKDVSTIRDFLERLPEAARESVGFILDRGFTSYGLLDDFRKEGIRYVVPLKKNLSLLSEPDALRWRGTFLYRDRPIRWASTYSEQGTLYVFEDPELRGHEEKALLRRVNEKRTTMREFEERKRVAGVIGMVSDMEMKGPRMYDLYKGREDVELAFDALKNTLDSGKTYSRGEESVRGFFLVSFLAMRVYFKILRRLRERKLTNKISVEEVVFELSKVERIVERNGREYYATIPKRARNILSLFSDAMPMG